LVVARVYESCPRLRNWKKKPTIGIRFSILATTVRITRFLSEIRLARVRHVRSFGVPVVCWRLRESKSGTSLCTLPPNYGPPIRRVDKKSSPVKKSFLKHGLGLGLVARNRGTVIAVIYSYESGVRADRGKWQR